MRKLDYSWKGIDASTALKISRELALDNAYHSIDFSNNKRLGDRDAHIILKALIDSSPLQELMFSYSNLGMTSAKSLSELLSTSLALETLNLNNNAFTTDAIKILGQGLQNNASLIFLSLDINHIKAEGLSILLSSCCSEKSVLQILSVQNCGIGALQEVGLISLKHNKVLQTLSLYSNQIGDSASYLFTVLQENKSLHHLNLEKNQITSDVNNDLAELLSKNQSLSILNLSQNNIGKKNFDAVAMSLGKNKGLRHLSLNDCSLSDQSFTLLAKQLGFSHHLEHIELGSNQITSEGLRKVSEEINKNALKSLILCKNSIGDKGIPYLVNFISKSPQLTKIDISKCHITPKKLDMLFSYLQNEENNIIEINLSYNEIGDDKGASVIANYLASNNKLKKLYLDECAINNKGASTIAKALRKNSQLIRISQSNKLGHRKHDVANEIHKMLAANYEMYELEMLEKELGEH